MWCTCFPPGTDVHVHVQALVKGGDVQQVQDGLEIFAKKGEWDRLFEVAQEQGLDSQTTKYSMLYATQLADQGKCDEAVRVMAKFGTQVGAHPRTHHTRLALVRVGGGGGWWWCVCV